MVNSWLHWLMYEFSIMELKPVGYIFNTGLHVLISYDRSSVQSFYFSCSGHTSSKIYGLHINKDINVTFNVRRIKSFQKFNK